MKVYLHIICAGNEPSSSIHLSKADALESMKATLFFSWNHYVPDVDMPDDPFLAGKKLKHYNPQAPRHYIEEVEFESNPEFADKSFENEHPFYTKTLWRRMVEKKLTTQGYWEWLVENHDGNMKLALTDISRMSKVVWDFADCNWSIHHTTDNADIELEHFYDPTSLETCASIVQTRLTVSAQKSLIFATANLKCETRGSECKDRASIDLQNEVASFVLPEALRLQSNLKAANFNLKIDRNQLPMWL